MKNIVSEYKLSLRSIAHRFTHSLGIRRFFPLSAATLILLLTTSAVSNAEYLPPHSNPGPASDIINFSAYAVEIAPKEIEAGAMDMYIFSLKTPAAEKLQNNKDIQVYQAPASMVSIILNPAPAADGEFNPLAIKEIRQAIQYVVNRPFVSQEIYKGFAMPMLSHVSPADFDKLTVYEDLRTSNISYDPQLARDMVDQAMLKSGAKSTDEFWHYNGKRIDLKFIVRTEDERWDIGNTLRSELNKLGFSVILIPQQFGPAVFTVYSTDPKLFQWHIYTEGWGRGSPEKYDFASINQMCAPWLGNMPGWQEVGFWQYEQETLDELGKKIFTGEFKDIEERNEIYKQATKKCLDESVRIWVATAVNNFPASSELQGITEDLVAGPNNLWTFRDVYVPGKSEINIGNLWVSTNQTTWNPIGGFGDVYSSDIWKSINDPPLTNHPFTGLPIPFRASYHVESAGPNGKLELPASAIEWDADNSMWRNIKSVTKSTSKVTFDYSKYFQSKWHHGRYINMADVLYPIAQLFDMVYNTDKANIEFSISTTSKPFTDTVRGFNLTKDNKLEVYVDFWHFIPDYIGQYASISSISMPWEINAAMDDLVFNQRKASYSDTSATRFNNTWIDLVSSKDARLVRNTLRHFLETEYIPTNIFDLDSQPLVNEQSAKERYQAAIDWFSQKDHMVISNGPYYLEKFKGGGEQFAQIRAFRDPSYPFKPGDMYKGAPDNINFSYIEKPLLEYGKDFKASVHIEGPGTLSLNYVLTDPTTGKNIASGEYPNGDKGQFDIVIPNEKLENLDGSIYHLFLIAYSDQLAKIVERRIDIELASDSQTRVNPSKDQSGQTNNTNQSQNTKAEENSNSSPFLIIGLILGTAAIIALGLIILIVRSRKEYN